MKKIISLTATALILTSSAFLFSSCGKKNTAQTTTVSEAKPVNPAKTAVKLKHINSETKEYLSDKKIAVVLGHSYNDEATVSNFKQLLDLNYGLNTEEKPGLIELLVYPEDFMVAGKPRISSLYNQLEDYTLAGIITFGAPEGLCNAMARLEDLSIKRQEEMLKSVATDTENSENTKTELFRDYPVFSFFQQDDTLGSESTADFVLDYTPKTTVLEEETTAVIPNFDSSQLLLNSLQAMINLRGPVPADKKLQVFVQKLIGKQKKVLNYNDYETGLKSVNHFIFE